MGSGLAANTEVGPLANPRRLEAIHALVQDAVSHGARLVAGGKRAGGSGLF